MGWFKKKEKEQIKYITKKMDRAIETLQNKAEYKRNAILERGIRYLSSHLEEISKEMIDNATALNYKYPCSNPHLIQDIFGLEPHSNEFLMLRSKIHENIFVQYLIDNKITMAVNEEGYVKFAYGRHVYFGNGWHKFAGYAYY